jgi:hypothetical protein
MVKGMYLHSHISNDLTSLDEILRLYKTMKHVDCSSSHSKGELKPSLGHFQQNRFIVGNNLWKCLSMLMKIMSMMNSLMNFQNIRIEMNLWMIYFEESCKFIAYFLKMTNPQKKNIDWFSCLVSISEECDLNNQTISHSQDSSMTTKDRGA